MCDIYSCYIPSLLIWNKMQILFLLCSMLIHVSFYCDEFSISSVDLCIFHMQHIRTRLPLCTTKGLTRKQSMKSCINPNHYKLKLIAFRCWPQQSWIKSAYYSEVITFLSPLCKTLRKIRSIPLENGLTSYLNKNPPPPYNMAETHWIY